MNPLIRLPLLALLLGGQSYAAEKEPLQVYILAGQSNIREVDPELRPLRS